MSKTNALEDAIINHIFRTTKFTGPTNLYIALFTTATAEDGTGTEVPINGSTNYARAAVASIDANWSAPTGGNGQTSNSGAITFNTPGVTGWGSVTHFAIMSAATAGTMYYQGPLTAAKTINSGDPAPSFPIASLVVTEG